MGGVTIPPWEKTLLLFFIRVNIKKFCNNCLGYGWSHVRPYAKKLFKIYILSGGHLSWVGVTPPPMETFLIKLFQNIFCHGSGSPHPSGKNCL